VRRCSREPWIGFFEVGGRAREHAERSLDAGGGIVILGARTSFGSAPRRGETDAAVAEEEER
jgi:hypothetical protein